MEDFIEGNKDLYARFNEAAHDHVEEEIKQYHKLAAACPSTPPRVIPGATYEAIERRAAKRAAKVARGAKLVALRLEFPADPS